MPFRFNPCSTCCGNILCEHCDAGTSPSAITATFNIGFPAADPDPACDTSCNEFEGAWELPQLTQAEIDTIHGACPNAFEEVFPLEGCYFGITEGLPCGATAMILGILDGGTEGAGFANGTLAICMLGAATLNLIWWIATDDTNQDCTANIDTNGGGLDNSTPTSVGGPPPCETAWLNFVDADLELEATA